MKILLTGSFTLDLLYRELQITLPEHEIILDLYDNYIYQLTNKNSELNKGKYDCIILYLDSTDKKVNSEFEYIINNFKIENSKILFISSTPVQHINYETFLYSIPSLNLTNIKSDYVIDIDKLVHMVGFKNIYDTRSWYYGKILFKLEFYVEIARAYASVINSHLGKVKKVLVLDLDNTLWYGISGDEGIIISQDGIYSSYWEFQEKLKHLKETGILLAISSKNDLSTVVETFERNKMPLALSDFVSVKCNWNDKAMNIQEIAKEINVGLDSIVFIDDNPVEIEWIKLKIPQVECCLFNFEQFTKYPQLLDDIDSLKNIRITKEDTQRTEMLQQEIKRKKMEVSSLTQEDFIKSLDIKYTIEANNFSQLERIAQLTQKTNQFNVTLEKYNEKKLSDLVKEGGKFYSVSIRDKFGDYGIIAVATVVENKITTFVVSCRAFNRGVEFELLNEIKNDFPDATLTFVKSDKNNVAKDFMKKIHSYQENKFKND